MEVIRDLAPGTAKRVLLIMLPGATDKPEDFVERGFIRALRDRNVAVDVAAVDAHMDYYLERTIVERLHQDVVVPARAEGYEQIWVLGISLGGMGCLLYLREHAKEIAGVVLLAPYLGSRGTIAEIIDRGGFQHWQFDRKTDDEERVFLHWLQSALSLTPAVRKMYLAYGAEDRFAPASALLSELLPPQQVITLPGGHDWHTWLALWINLQDRKLFCV